jgi:hypothetical protein
VCHFSEEFKRIYKDLLEGYPSLPGQHAIAQEKHIHDSFNNRSYKNMAVNTLTKLRKRVPVMQPGGTVGIIGQETSQVEEFLKSCEDNTVKGENNDGLPVGSAKRKAQTEADILDTPKRAKKLVDVKKALKYVASIDKLREHSFPLFEPGSIFPATTSTTPNSTSSVFQLSQSVQSTSPSEAISLTLMDDVDFEGFGEIEGLDGDFFSSDMGLSLSATQTTFIESRPEPVIKQCDRCKNSFELLNDDQKGEAGLLDILQQDIDLEACSFHYGRLRLVRESGKCVPH